MSTVVFTAPEGPITVVKSHVGAYAKARVGSKIAVAGLWIQVSELFDEIGSMICEHKWRETNTVRQMLQEDGETEAKEVDIGDKRGGFKQRKQTCPCGAEQWV